MAPLCPYSGSKQGEQTAWLLDLKQEELCQAYEHTRVYTHAHTLAWTADFLPLPGIHTRGLTHPAPLLTWTPGLGYCVHNTTFSPVGSPPIGLVL